LSLIAALLRPEVPLIDQQRTMIYHGVRMLKEDHISVCFQEKSLFDDKKNKREQWKKE